MLRTEELNQLEVLSTVKVVGGMLEIRRDRRSVTNETDALSPQQVSPLVEENRKARNYRR